MVAMAYEENTEQAAPAAQPENGEKPEVNESRSALVKSWVEKIKDSEKHFKDAFTRMDDCMQLAADGADKEWLSGDNYTVPVVNRHINLSVAHLYARDPRVQAKRRRRLMYQIWDGDPETLVAAAAAVQPPADPQTGAPLTQPVAGPEGQPVQVDAQGQPWQPDPQSVALLQEVQAAAVQMKMLNKLGKTTEILWDYFTGEQSLGFKQSMKALVRRTKVCGVGYLDLSYQREMKPNPEIVSQIDDATSQIAELEKLQADLAGGEVEENDKKIEELRLLKKTLEEQQFIIAREGPLFDFPGSKTIIVDKCCTHLKTFAGAGWIARKFLLTPDKVEKEYKVKLNGHFAAYKKDGEKNESAIKRNESLACLWRVQDKEKGQVFVVCDGYDDFIQEPAAPDVKIERFWTVFPLVFNEVEHEDQLYPPSDVWLLRHPQREYNRSREGLREHRVAARPQYAAAANALSRNDKKKLESGAAHAVLELKALKPGTGKVEDLIQQIKKAAIDPNIYDTAPQLDDIQRTVGVPADMGPPADSATEASISEQGRSVSLTDNIDDLDDMLSQVARAFGQLCLMELSKETVIEICGPGAVWPDAPQTREEIAKDLYLEIKAGSSGRPNRAADLANMERGMPFLVQIPGIKPKSLAEKYVTLLELGVDIEDIYVEGMPSITALNAMAGKQAQLGTGDPASDPNAQGDKGGQNEQKPGGKAPAGQPAYAASAGETQKA
jgi:hypothetical protein